MTRSLRIGYTEIEDLAELRCVKFGNAPAVFFDDEDLPELVGWLQRVIATRPAASKCGACGK